MALHFTLDLSSTRRGSEGPPSVLLERIASTKHKQQVAGRMQQPQTQAGCLGTPADALFIQLQRAIPPTNMPENLELAALLASRAR